MVLTQSWCGLMVRNRRGQHQRRPRLSLMGPAASSVLIRSLSLKSTHWPLYLHELSSCSMAPDIPTNIWPCESSLVTLASQQHIQGSTVYVIILALSMWVPSHFHCHFFSVWITALSVSLILSFSLPIFYHILFFTSLYSPLLFIRPS